MRNSSRVSASCAWITGPGYRVYFVKRGKVLVVLLCGGDKNSQTTDVRKAKAMAGDLEI